MKYRVATWCDCSGSICGLYFSSINFWIICIIFSVYCGMEVGKGRERGFTTWGIFEGAKGRFASVTLVLFKG